MTSTTLTEPSPQPQLLFSTELVFKYRAVKFLKEMLVFFYFLPAVQKALSLCNDFLIVANVRRYDRSWFPQWRWSGISLSPTSWKAGLFTWLLTLDKAYQGRSSQPFLVLYCGQSHLLMVESRKSGPERTREDSNGDLLCGASPRRAYSLKKRAWSLFTA